MSAPLWRTGLWIGIVGAGWQLSFNATAGQRIVSTDGAITEILFALGAQDQLVGVDTTSQYPAQARALPSVGYRRTLTAEGMLALQPDAIIVTPESGPSDTLDRLERSGIKLLRVKDVVQPQDILSRVEQIAQWVDKADAGKQLQKQLQQQLQQVQAQLPLTSPPTVLFLLAAGNRGMMVAGRNTQAQKMLDALGLPNLAENIESYKPLNQESLLALQPQLIVVAETQPGAFNPAHWPSMATTPAGHNQRIAVFDSMYLLGMGPRLPVALAELLAAAKHLPLPDAHAD